MSTPCHRSRTAAGGPSLFVIASALLFVPTVVSQTGIVRIAPIADATVDESLPTTNFGSDPELRAGMTTTMPPPRLYRRACMQFDLTPYMNVPVPDRARIRWYQHRADVAFCIPVKAFRITIPWTESGVTWNNKPAHDPLPTGMDCVGDSSDLGWKTFDVTTMVRDWLRRTQPNHGVVIKDHFEHQSGPGSPGYAHSRESSQVALRPELELSWGTFSFGTGCRVFNRLPLLDLIEGAPGLGGRYTLTATGLETLPFGGGALLLVGVSSSSFLGLPLPFSLAQLGFRDCSLLVSADAFLAGSAAGTTMTFKIDVPSDPSLRGGRVFHQVAYLFPQPLFLMMTNGYQVTMF